MIPKRNARSPMTRARSLMTRPRSSSYDAEAEGSAVMAELKTHTDKYSAEDVKQALERSSVDPGSVDERHIHRDSSISSCRG